MLQHEAVVRVGCAKCRTFFDVDLMAVEAVRGGHYSLIDRTTQCKITSCRGRGYFIAARRMDARFLLLVNAHMVQRPDVEQLRPIDIEPPTPPPPAPTVGAWSVRKNLLQVHQSASR